MCSSWQQLINPDPDAFEKLMVYQYLRYYHAPIWRILERQPWSLEVLKAVIIGNTAESYSGMPTGLQKSDQRMMEEFFSRAFSHVLKPRVNDDIQESDTHQGMNLEQAVGLFLERVDRKRSDEYFIQILKELVFDDKVYIETAYLNVL